MKILAASLLTGVLCFLAPCAGASERLTDDEQEVIDEFSSMATLAAPLGIGFKVLVIADTEDDGSPMSMGYRDGTCTLVLRVRNNTLYRTLLLARDGHAKPLKLRSILAHEMGHCFRRFFADHGPASPAETQAPLGLTAGYLAVSDKKERHDSEVQADLFALAWASIYNPAEYDEVYAYLQEIRFRLCVDKSGRYARRHELEQGLSDLPAPGSADPRLLVRLATVGTAARAELAADEAP
jgi:hypothetical protein